MPKLSKTRYMGGLQCLKRLWLDDRRRDLALPPDPATRVRLSAGHRVGVLARDLWPSGVLVRESPARHERAVQRTRALLEDPEVPAIFEAAFAYQEVRIRVDALQRDGDGFSMFEVKSSSKPKPEHVNDLAIQTWVVDGSGIEITAASLVHLDTKSVWHGGPYDASALFAVADLTEQVLERVREVPGRVAEMQEALQRDAEPPVAVGAHCTRPYTCPFFAYCNRDAPLHPILELPRASVDLIERLTAGGAESIDSISEDLLGSAGLSELQAKVHRVVVSGRTEVDAASLKNDLELIRFPVAFLDFETFAPVLPRYPGTHPHEVIPFQWSMHVVSESGEIEHRQFLWTEDGDPRPSFVQSLAESLPAKGSVVVYSGYERGRLAALAESFGSKARRLFRTFAAREVDLALIVRAGVYHPDFHGSFSLKRVLPALVAEGGYADLEIRDGGDASAAFAELLNPETTVGRRKRLVRAMLAYCKRDTDALVRLYEALRALSEPEVA